MNQLRLLANQRPNHFGRCRFASRGCRCYMKDVSSKGQRLRRRAQRFKENRQARELANLARWERNLLKIGR